MNNFRSVLAASALCSSRSVSIDIQIHQKHHHQQGDGKRKRNKGQQRKDSGRPSYRFVDRTRVRVAGGAGGNGSTSMFRIGRKHKRRPDGGHGGNGGSVVIVADPSEQSLRWSSPHVSAAPGTHGSSQGKNGRNGKNLVIRVPCGVVVRRVLDYDEEWDPETQTVRKLGDNSREGNDENFGVEEESWPENEAGYEPVHNPVEFEDVPLNLPSLDKEEFDGEDGYDDNEYFEGAMAFENNDAQEYNEFQVHTPWGEREKIDLADLDKPGSFVVVARGGRGGTGSSVYASRNGPLPEPEVIARIAKPKPFEEAALELELKLIADVGLVGFPNAGKSSLLSAMSRATPFIAPYPFTTLHPLVGYIEYQDGFRVCAADVPGIISGASEGRGKGIDFLRHLERTKALLYIVDAAGCDGRDPLEDLRILTEEIAAYADGDMVNRRSLVVANKLDLLDEIETQEVLLGLGSIAEEVGINVDQDVLGISAGVTGEGLAPLSRAIRKVVTLSDSDRAGRENGEANALQQ
jgi:Obg family GTPase CgtA